MIGAQPQCRIPVGVPSLPLGLVSQGAVLFVSGPGVICLALVCGSGWGPANLLPRPSTQWCWVGQGQMGPGLHFGEEPSLVSLYPGPLGRKGRRLFPVMSWRGVRELGVGAGIGWLPLENS